MRSLTGKLTILLLIVFVLVCMVSCANATNTNNITMCVVDGISALSVTTLLADSSVDNYFVDVEFVSEDMIYDAISMYDADMIVLPMDTASQLYTSGQQYQLVAVTTFGAMYLVSTGNDMALSDLVGEVIYVAGCSNVSLCVLEHLLISNNIEYTISGTAVAGKVALCYGSSNVVLRQLATGNIQYAILEEPLATQAVELAQSNGIDLRFSIDMQSQWQSVMGSYGYADTALLVKSSLIANNYSLMMSICQRLDSNSQYLYSDTDNIVQLLQDNGSVYFDNVDLSTDLLYRCNVGFEYASYMIGDVYYLLQVIEDIDSSIIGGDIPDDDFVYNPFR